MNLTREQKYRKKMNREKVTDSVHPIRSQSQSERPMTAAVDTSLDSAIGTRPTAKNPVRSAVRKKADREKSENPIDLRLDSS